MFEILSKGKPLNSAQRKLIIKKCNDAYKKFYGRGLKARIFPKDYSIRYYGPVLVMFDEADHKQLSRWAKFDHEFAFYAQWIFRLDTGECIEAICELEPLTDTERVLYGI